MKHQEQTTPHAMMRWIRAALFACILLGPGSEQTADQASVQHEELVAQDPNSEPVATAPAAWSNGLPVATHLGEWVTLGPKNYGGQPHDPAPHPPHNNKHSPAHASY